MKGGGGSRVGPLHEVGGQDERGRDLHGTRPFSDLVHRAGRPQDKGLKMAEDRWRRMLLEAFTGLDLDRQRERGRRPRVQMLRELLQTEGWY